MQTVLSLCHACRRVKLHKQTDCCQNTDLVCSRVQHEHTQIVTNAVVACSYRFDGDMKSDQGLKLVDEYHRKYITALQALWDSHKDKYTAAGTSEFKLVE